MRAYQAVGNKSSLTEKSTDILHLPASLYLILTSVNVPFSALQEKIAQGLR